MDQIKQITEAFSAFMWGTPLLILLLGGGIFFLVYSGLTPFRYFGHAWMVLTGKYDKPDETGQITHFQALSTALAATVGMGNISGVAVAIATGGPGAVFWMWISAIVGTATKFFTCTLAVMYRGKDDQGEIQGGPMYVITEGLGPRWKPLAVLFSLACLVGVLPVFQANQLSAAVKDILIYPAGIESSWQLNLIIGIIITVLVAIVVIGGIERIANTAGKLVPAMVVLYFIMVISVLAMESDKIWPSLVLIIDDAMTGDAALGGALGALIITGVKRGTFSNESGLGTAPMAHGAAKTDEPVREGMVAMLGPFIDTIIVCTLTALTIIVTGVWQSSEANGIRLTTEAFSIGLPGFGHYLLVICITIFSLTTMFAYPYYGMKAFSFLFGTKYTKAYAWFYILSILIGVSVSLEVVINLIDGMYATMAIPTVISAIMLSPKVRTAAKDYFRRLKEN